MGFATNPAAKCIMQKILLTGASGLLGTHLYNHLNKKYNIISLYNLHKPLQQSNCIQFDIAITNGIEKLINTIQPNIVIHTAAISSIAQCQNDEIISYKINVLASETLAKVCKKINAQFVFCSTDLVFDGIIGNYNETDLPNPINIYGKQKFEAEQKCLGINNKTLIIRLPLMIGENKIGTSGVIAEMQLKNINNETMHLFTNEFRSVALVTDVVNAIKFLIQKNKTGIFHIGGNQKLNRMQIGVYVKAKYNLQNITLIPTTHKEQNITNRPQDVSLDSSKLKKLGFKCKSIL